MKKPIIGIVTNNQEIDSGYPITSAGRFEVEAVAELCNAIPILLPATCAVITSQEAFDLCDGFLLPGGRANVHPNHYGVEPTPAHGMFNGCRDRLSLPLIRMAVEAGKPILGICRGHQEINVAFGGTLFAEVRDLPGRMNHRMPPDGTIEEKFARRHNVELRKGGKLAQIMGKDEVFVNTLHGQAVDKPGENIEIEGFAEDGTVEAISVKGSKNFAIGVQWHPEYSAAQDDVSAPLFKAFGDALRN